MSWGWDEASAIPVMSGKRYPNGIQFNGVYVQFGYGELSVKGEVLQTGGGWFCLMRFFEDERSTVVSLGDMYDPLPSKQKAADNNHFNFFPGGVSVPAALGVDNDVDANNPLVCAKHLYLASMLLVNQWRQDSGGLDWSESDCGFFSTVYMPPVQTNEFDFKLLGCVRSLIKNSEINLATRHVGGGLLETLHWDYHARVDSTKQLYPYVFVPFLTVGESTEARTSASTRRDCKLVLLLVFHRLLVKMPVPLLGLITSFAVPFLAWEIQYEKWLKSLSVH